MAPHKARLPSRPKPKLTGSFVPRRNPPPLQVVNSSQRLPPGRPISQEALSCHENPSQQQPLTNSRVPSQRTEQSQPVYTTNHQDPRPSHYLCTQPQMTQSMMHTTQPGPSARESIMMQASSQPAARQSTIMTPSQEEIEALRERNFELEAWVQTVEAEKAMAIERGIAAAKAELQFKEAELREAERAVERLSKKSGETIARRVSRPPLIQTPHTTRKETQFSFSDSSTENHQKQLLNLVFSSSTESDASNIWLQVAADSHEIRIALEGIARRELDSGPLLLEAMVRADHLQLALEIVDAIDLDAITIDPEHASRIALSALMKNTSPRHSLILVLALERNCASAGGLNDDTVRALWEEKHQHDFFFIEQANHTEGGDHAFAELTMAFAVRQHLVRETDQQNMRIDFFHTVVWPRVANVAFLALKQNKIHRSRIVLRGLIDAAAAVAVENPDRARSLFTAFPALIPGLIQFANDSLDLNLTERSIHFDDASSLIHLLGHLAYFAVSPASDFVHDFLQPDVLTPHELRALCHRIRFSVPKHLTNEALLRDANHLLATLTEYSAAKRQATAAPANKETTSCTSATAARPSS